MMGDTPAPDLRDFLRRLDALVLLGREWPRLPKSLVDHAGGYHWRSETKAKMILRDRRREAEEGPATHS